jgi:hypothetical protein
MMLPALDRLFPYLGINYHGEVCCAIRTQKISHSYIGVFMNNLDTFLPYMSETLPNINALLYHLSWGINDTTKPLLKYKIVAAR